MCGRTSDARAKHSASACRGDGVVQHGDGMRVFGADVDVTLRRPNRDAGDRHALDQNEGIALHDHAIRKGAAVALIGITDDVFLLGRGIGHGLPFDSGREARPAAAAQPRLGHLIHHGGGRHLQGAREALVAVVGAVIVQRARIDDAATRKCEPCLILQIRNLFGFAQSQRMVLAAIRGRGLQDRDRVRHGDGSIGDPALRGRNLDHRLEPVQAARAVAHDVDLETPLRTAAAADSGAQHRRRRPRPQRRRPERKCEGRSSIGLREQRIEPASRRAAPRPCRRASPPATPNTGRGNRPAQGSRYRRRWCRRT